MPGSEIPEGPPASQAAAASAPGDYPALPDAGLPPGGAPAPASGGASAAGNGPTFGDGAAFGNPPAFGDGLASVDTTLLAGVPASAEVMFEDGTPGPRKPRRLGAVLAAAGVATAVLVAGGAFAVVRYWNGPVGTLPEAVMPASVAAFARLDLAPGIGQRVKFDALLRRAGGSGPKSVDETKRQAFSDLQASISYDDVAAWFDDRIGVAVWPDAAGKPTVLAAVAAKDSQKAKKSLAAVQQKQGSDHFGFAMLDGYALLAFAKKDSQQTADAAAKAPHLSADPAFTAALAKLPADQPGLAWADLSRAAALEPTVSDLAFGESIGGPGAPFGGPGELTDTAGAAPMPELSGTLIAGLQATDDALELRARFINTKNVPFTGTGNGADLIANLGALPSDARMAAAADSPAGDLSAFGAEGMALTAFLFPEALMGAEPAGSDEPPFKLPPNIDPNDDEAVDKYLSEHPELFTDLLAGSVGDPAVLKGGESLAKALPTAKSFTLTIAGADTDEQGLPVQLDLRLPTAAAATQLKNDLASVVSTAKATCTVQGDHLVLRTAKYAGAQTPLSSTPLFKQTMQGALQNPTAAIYVPGTADMAPIKSMGLTTARDGQDTVLLARILL
ncbi:hypothetical protein [Dactylosporangium sp. NPDC006015]|uniref:hypothetical protein n=1 Tax=Dactylosporangium sp. NPDC006015 TaxID=3154576 RepID=UPI0033BF3794